MAFRSRERLLIVCVLAFLAVLPACSAWRSASRGTGPVQSAPGWAVRQGFSQNGQAVQGAKIFAQAGCLQCHTYLGAGSSNLGAPDLSSIGKTSNRGTDDFAAYVADPSKFGNNVMPKFADLGQKNLRRLGAFLEASKGPK